MYYFIIECFNSSCFSFVLFYFQLGAIFIIVERGLIVVEGKPGIVGRISSTISAFLNILVRIRGIEKEETSNLGRITNNEKRGLIIESVLLSVGNVFLTCVIEKVFIEVPIIFSDGALLIHYILLHED